ncbi:MAG: CHAD domain-containing protein [Limisphaerales bacterium]
MPDALDLRRSFARELRRVLRRASRGSGSADIHAVRKGITRLRSWLRLAREPLGTRRFHTHNRRLRGAARILAPMRDARVTLAAFEAVGSAASFPNTSKRLHRQARRAKQSAAGALRKVKRQLKKEREAISHLPSGKRTRRDFVAGLEEMRGEMNAAFDAARARAGVESLHTWRKRTKNYLHALDFLGINNRRQKSAARVNQFLGEEHDFTLLEADITAHRSKPECDELLGLIAARRLKLRLRLFPR